MAGCGSLRLAARMERDTASTVTAAVLSGGDLGRDWELESHEGASTAFSGVGHNSKSDECHKAALAVHVGHPIRRQPCHKEAAADGY